MSTLRFHAIKESLTRKPLEIKETERRSEIFGANVFNEVSKFKYLKIECPVCLVTPKI